MLAWVSIDTYKNALNLLSKSHQLEQHPSNQQHNQHVPKHTFTFEQYVCQHRKRHRRPQGEPQQPQYAASELSTVSATDRLQTRPRSPSSTLARSSTTLRTAAKLRQHPSLAVTRTPTTLLAASRYSTQTLVFARRTLTSIFAGYAEQPEHVGRCEAERQGEARQHVDG
jgi:hypothetical protein